MVVSNDRHVHESLVAVRTEAPSERRVRSLIDQIATDAPAAEDLLRPSSEDGYAFFEVWEAALVGFEAWEIFPLGFPQGERYVVMQHVEKYEWSRVEHWASALEVFQRASTLHLNRPCGENNEFIHLSIVREATRGRFGVSYWLPMQEAQEEDFLAIATAILAAWDVNDLVRVDTTHYRGRTGFTVCGQDESVRIVISEYPRPSEMWFPKALRIYAFKGVREPLSKLEKSLLILPASPEDLRFQGQVGIDEYPRISRRLFELSPTWNFSWTGRYKKGFDPLARPEVGAQPLRYPLLVSKSAGSALSLQVDMVHAPDRSFLEFQSAKGFDYLGSLLEKLKMPCERWEGPFGSRWGVVPRNR